MLLVTAYDELQEYEAIPVGALSPNVTADPEDGQKVLSVSVNDGKGFTVTVTVWDETAPWQAPAVDVAVKV